jgi:FkbM family methyltransferase
MNRYAARHGLDNVFCYSMGVYDRNGYLGFDGADTVLTISGEAAHDGHGVHVARLDDVVDEASYLRLEVEGSEVPALHGATALLQRQRPKLALSVYHRPEDFLTIPVCVQQLDRGYEFLLRHQSLEAGVLCIYCR